MSDNKVYLDQIKSNLEAYCDKNFDFNFKKEHPIVRLHEPTFGAEEIFAATETMLSTYVTMGKKVKAFERQYAEKFGHQYGVMVNSGSSANLLAVSVLANPVTENHLKPGDEVIVPALSWATTVWPLIQHNLVPVFVDCDPQTFNFDMNKLEAAITSKTKAIMLVHVYGNPCDMDSLMSIAKKHNLHVIEDCCESMGAYYKNKAVGTFGKVGTFSFYFSHHITTLEGGICVTDDYEFTENMRIMRAHGWSREAEQHQKYVEKYPDIDPRFIFINIGYNIRPTEVQAAMGELQLPKLDNFVARRRETAAFYSSKLAKYDDLFSMQQETPDSISTWFGFSLIMKPNAPFTNKQLASFLQENGIETRPIIAGNMAKHPALQMFPHRVAGDLEQANNIMKNGLAFGNHQHIDQAAREYVISKIEAFINKF